MNQNEWVFYEGKEFDLSYNVNIEDWQCGQCEEIGFSCTRIHVSNNDLRADACSFFLSGKNLEIFRQRSPIQLMVKAVTQGVERRLAGFVIAR